MVAWLTVAQALVELGSKVARMTTVAPALVIWASTVALAALTRVTLAWGQQAVPSPGAQRSRRAGKSGLLAGAHCRIAHRIGS